MKHVVLKPFAWCPDGTGITNEPLVEGDERDFGDMADGLLAESYIGEPEKAPEPAKPATKAKK